MQYIDLGGKPFDDLPMLRRLNINVYFALHAFYKFRDELFHNWSNEVVFQKQGVTSCIFSLIKILSSFLENVEFLARLENKPFELHLWALNLIFSILKMRWFRISGLVFKQQWLNLLVRQRAFFGFRILPQLLYFARLLLFRLKLARHKTSLSNLKRNAVNFASVDFSCFSCRKFFLTLRTNKCFSDSFFFKGFLAVYVIHFDMRTPVLPRQNLSAAFVRAPVLNFWNLVVFLNYLIRILACRKNLCFVFANCNYILTPRATISSTAKHQIKLNLLILFLKNSS